MLYSHLRSSSNPPPDFRSTSPPRMPVIRNMVPTFSALRDGSLPNKERVPSGCQRGSGRSRLHAEQSNLTSGRSQESLVICTGPHEGVANQARQKVHMIHAEMALVGDTISVLQAENEHLKIRLLQERHSQMAKYFALSDTQLLQVVFGEWKRSHDLGKFVRDVENVQRTRVHERSTNESIIHCLEAQMRQMMETQTKSDMQLDALEKRCEQAESLIYSWKCSADQYPFPPQPIMPPDMNAGEYLKAKLHEILRDVDPRYLAPLYGPSVQEIATQERIAYRQGSIMHAAGPHVPPLLGLNAVTHSSETLDCRPSSIRPVFNTINWHNNNQVQSPPRSNR